MTPGVVYCYEEQTIDEAARVMRDKQIRRLPILSRSEKLVGIFSLGDVALKAHEPTTASRVLEGLSRTFQPQSVSRTNIDGSTDPQPCGVDAIVSSAVLFTNPV